MPELPEVETIVRRLAGRLAGQRIERVHLARRDIIHGHPVPIRAALRNRRIQQVERHGKAIRISLAEGWSLFVHLGMTGRLTLADRDQPVEAHTHLRLTFHRRRFELRFVDPRRFGAIWVVDSSRADGAWIGRRLPSAGADPLKLPYARWRALLQRRRQIKALLLDQEPISGVGNIYCDESLHRAGIHPLTLACDLDAARLRRLWRALRRVLAEAIRAGGSSVRDYRTADNTPGAFQHRHRVYHRAGQPCRRCQTPIQRIVVAGRGTFICPACQPTPEEVAAMRITSGGLYARRPPG